MNMRVTLSPRKPNSGKKSKSVSKSTGSASPQDLVPAEDRAGANAQFATEEYNKAARAAKLEGLLLVSSSFEAKRKPSYVSDLKPDGSNAKYMFNSKSENFEFNEKDGVAKCTWIWSLTATLDDTPSIIILASYEVYYSNLLECDGDAVARFMKRVGRFATYPYFRAHVSQISWESSTNLPLLPTIAS